MLNGSIGDKILLFSIPIALTQILEQLFNAADIAVIGRFVGKGAMAAVGANSPVVGLIVTFFAGISIGCNVIIARRIGQGDKERERRAAATTVQTALIAGVVVMIIGEIMARWLLRRMSVPAEVMDDAVLYLRIFLAGVPAVLLYNFESAIFRAKGNTRTPLYCLVIAGCVNVALNLFFVLAIGMTVNGVALATVISNVISSGLMFVSLARDEDLQLLARLKEGLDRESVRSIISLGLPAGLQGTVFSLSNIIVQSAVNSLGTDIIAASSAAFNIEIMAYFIINSFGQACTTFTGQNYGAGNRKRCRRVMRICVLQDEIGTVAIDILFIVMGHQLLSLFNTDPAVVSNGYTRLLFILVPGVVNVLIELFSGALRGYGHSLMPALISLFGVCGVRIGWVTFFFPKYHTFKALLVAYPASWVVTAAALAVAYFLFIRSESRKAKE